MEETLLEELVLSVEQICLNLGALRMPKSRKFRELLASTEKSYAGKKVPKKYQERYGKVYSEDEAQSIGFAIAGKKGWKR
jgi:HEPN domain-containing protein